MDKTTFSGQNTSVLYSNYTEAEPTTTAAKTTIDITTASNENWNPPSSWTGPSAALYQNFNSSYGFLLIEGTQATSNPVPLVSGKVRYISFFRKNKQREIKK